MIWNESHPKLNILRLGVLERIREEERELYEREKGSKTTSGVKSKVKEGRVAEEKWRGIKKKYKGKQAAEAKAESNSVKVFSAP